MSDKLLKAEISTVLRKAEFKAMELLENAYIGKKIRVKDLNAHLLLMLLVIHL
jgi:hypothetical protein